MAQAIRFDLIAGVDKWNRGFRDAERTSSRFGARLRVGIASGAAAAAAGVGALAVGAFKLGESFDSAYDTIRVTTGKTGKSLAGLKKDFKAVVQDVPTDFESAATAVGKLNQRTGQTGKGLQRLAEQELELSRITKTDLGENIAASTRLFRDWSIPTRKQATTLDEMFRAAQATGIGVTDLMEKVVQFGSPLRQLGFNLDQTTALFGEFERAGVVTETVLPGLKLALKGYALAHKDPQKALIETIRRIKESSTAADANSIAFKTFGARAGPDLAAAIREGHFDLDKLIKLIAGGKDTIRGAAADTADFAEKWKVFSNRMKVLAEPAVSALFTAISTLATPALKGLSDFMTNTVIPGLKTLKKWWDDNKTSVGELASILGDTFTTSASDADISIGGLSKKLGGLAGILDRIMWASLLTTKDFIQLARFVGNLELRILDLVVAAGTALKTIGFFDPNTRKAGQAMVDWARDMKDKTRVQLGHLAEDSRRTQRQIDKMHDKTINIKGRDLVGPVARRIRRELADLTGVLPGQVLRSTLRGGVRREAKGDIVRGPTMAMVGEGRAPETIIPWDPAYRRRALDLWATTGRQLGIPGFAVGGFASRLTDEVSALPALRTRMLALGRQFGAVAGFGGGAESGNVIRLALAQAKRMAASFKVALALIEAGIVESGLRNLPYGDRDSLGFLQQRPSQGWAHPMNISYASWDFLRRAIPIQGRYGTAGALAQAVQRSAFPGRYNQVQARALGILHAYNYDRGGVLLPGQIALNATSRPEALGFDYDKMAAALVKALHAAPPRVAVDDIHTGLVRKKNGRMGGMSLGLS
jgi:hypothetical protein